MKKKTDKTYTISRKLLTERIKRYQATKSMDDMEQMIGKMYDRTDASTLYGVCIVTGKQIGRAHV